MDNPNKAECLEFYNHHGTQAITWIYLDDDLAYGVCLVSLIDETSEYSTSYAYHVEGVTDDFTCFYDVNNVSPFLAIPYSAKINFALLYKTDKTTFGEVLVNVTEYFEVRTEMLDGEYNHNLVVKNSSLPVYAFEINAQVFSNTEIIFQFKKATDEL